MYRCNSFLAFIAHLSGISNSRFLNQASLIVLLWLSQSAVSSASIPDELGTPEVQVVQSPETTSQSQEANRAAKQAFDEGMQLVEQRTPESLRQAIEKFEKALQLWRLIDDKFWEAITLQVMGLTYSESGQQKLALDYLNQSLLVFRRTVNHIWQARTLNRIGTVYSKIWELQKALESYNQALSLHRELHDHEGEAGALQNIGTLYSEIGDSQQALKFYSQALSLMQVAGDHKREASTLTYIGGIYYKLGEYRKALNLYQKALVLKQAEKDPLGEANTLSYISVAYSALGEQQKALEFSNQALALIRAIRNPEGEASILTQIGVIYSNLGQLQEAVDSYSEALRLSISIGDYNKGAQAVAGLSLIYFKTGQPEKALRYLNMALQTVRGTGTLSTETTILKYIGLIYTATGKHQKALKFNNEALLRTQVLGDRAGQAVVLSYIATVERNKGNFQKALTLTRNVIGMIEALRTNVDSQALRTSYFATQQGHYEFYIDLLMQLHKQNPSQHYDEEALHVSERARARGLLELLAEANANTDKDIDSQDAEKKRDLEQQIDALEKRLSSQTSEQPNDISQKLAALYRDYQGLKKTICTNNPDYGALQCPQPLTLQQIQRDVLDDQTVLLQYSLGEKRSYLWVVTPTSFNSYELPGRDKIQQAANTFRELLKRPGMEGVSPTQDISGSDGKQTSIAKAANALSQLILAPAAQHLGQKRLLIVADGALHLTPFAALTHPGTSTDQTYTPLIVNHEIVNLPSASTIATLREKLKGRKPAPKTLAVLADPIFSKDQTAAKQSPNLNLQIEWSALDRSCLGRPRPLKYSRAEAEAVLNFVPASERMSALDFDVSYNLVTSPQLSQYRYILFSTHACFDEDHPELSGIALSHIDRQGNPVDRPFLRIGDLFNLNLPAELVVLSACETGVGKEVKGEGIVGMTRGLMYAGAARVVTSLWRVNDESTSLLMKDFYRKVLKQGQSPTAALRAAQLEMWKQDKWKNPRSWAAFTLQGEWRGQGSNVSSNQ